MAFIITLECSRCGIEYGKIRFSRENKNKLAAAAEADGWRVWHGDFVFCPKCQALIESEKRPVGRPPKAKGPKRPVGRPRTREINDNKGITDTDQKSTLKQPYTGKNT